MYDINEISMNFHRPSSRPMTKEQVGEKVEKAALQRLMDRAEEQARQDICQDCLDRRCEKGRVCKEFLRRSKSYAWEIASEKAELN
jgi:hypothetical protein